MGFDTSTITLQWLRRVPSRLRAASGVCALALVGAVVGGLVGAGVGGCAAQTPAVAYNRPLTPEETREKQQLSPGDRSQAVSAFRSLAQSRTVVDPPGPAPYKVRWADVPLAVNQACDELGVEMVVVETVEQDGGLVFRMRTVEDWPATLEIRRVDPPKIYEIVDCRVGRFYEQPAKVARCDKLKAAFVKKLEKLGRVRWFNEP